MRRIRRQGRSCTTVQRDAQANIENIDQPGRNIATSLLQGTNDDLLANTDNQLFRQMQIQLCLLDISIWIPIQNTPIREHNKVSVAMSKRYTLANKVWLTEN